jgi:hypothetical protein
MHEIIFHALDNAMSQLRKDVLIKIVENNISFAMVQYTEQHSKINQKARHSTIPVYRDPATRPFYCRS